MSTYEQVPNDLSRHLEKHPFDTEFRMNIADIMGSKDPRGQLITEQCRPQDEQDLDLVARLLREHGLRMAAEDLGISAKTIPDGATFEFHQGFAWWPVQTSYDNLSAAITAGHYGRAHHNITAANFGIEDELVTINAKLVLYAPNRSITGPHAIYEMHRLLGLHVDQDQIWDLCALGATYPDAQRQFSIVGLGSSWVDAGGNRYVPCLDDWSDERELDLRAFGTEWDDSCRFAAVRK